MRVAINVNYVCNQESYTSVLPTLFYATRLAENNNASPS